jgi:hypothetical protein
MKTTPEKLLVIAIVALCTSSAIAACPSSGTPAPGSSIKHGLTVDGVCILQGVTINGGVIVEATGHLQLQSSTVNGGVGVFPGGELDVNATTLGAGRPTNTTSTIHGRITILNPFDVDIWTARLDGGLALSGTPSVSFPVICGNDVNGDSSFSNFALNGVIGIGTALGISCRGGNVFHGSVSLTNLTVEMGGNTIKGDLFCTNSTVIVTARNFITGRNTCY